MKLLKNLKSKYSNDVERLGVVLACGKIIETTNIHDEPSKGALMSSNDVFKYLYSGEYQTVATWHTHINESADLSGEDYSTFLMHPNLKHYIISEDEVKSYYVEDGEVVNG